MSVEGVFRACFKAIDAKVLITRANAGDKEFHFQNWFAARLAEAGLAWEPPKRNSYPDFRVTGEAEGYELKGLATPGRWISFDYNSQMPTGRHGGRSIYYVFGRYPKGGGDRYPVEDLVICSGDFLSAGQDYVHKNSSLKSFGDYGDIAIRMRKMYVGPTPFRLLNGVVGNRTLVLPADRKPGPGFIEVGRFVRREAATKVIGFDGSLETNALGSRTARNPNAGREHAFRAWRVAGGSADPVSLRPFDVAELDKDLAE